MMRLLLALASGAIFGAGLAVSGMADPARVRGFLDLLGPWDPTLAFVMAGAVIPMAIAWLVQRRLNKPLAEPAFSLPATTHLDGKLVLGAMLFGVGWGVSGLCPGPGLAGLVISPINAAVFVASMTAGVALHRATDR